MRDFRTIHQRNMGRNQHFRHWDKLLIRKKYHHLNIPGEAEVGEALLVVRRARLLPPGPEQMLLLEQPVLPQNSHTHQTHFYRKLLSHLLV